MKAGAISSEKGFSLIELMVTVAIIGILASVAVPNYAKMTAKARQSEAKSMLSNAYTAIKSFEAEAAHVTMCLYQAGFEPEGRTRYYGVGYLNAGWTDFPGANELPNNGVTCSSAAITWNGARRNDATFIQTVWANPSLNGVGPSGYYGTPTSSTFNAVAWGSIADVPVLDVWSINQAKNLVNEQPGF